MAEEYAATCGRVSRLKEVFTNRSVSPSTSRTTPKSFTKRHDEHQYLQLIEHIIQNGDWQEGRNGRTKSIFGHSMRFSLQNGTMPIITTKKTAWKTCLKELLWFIRGSTDNRLLKEQGVHIWDANGTREFLDSRGLTQYDVDELGPIYGRQWRHFNKPYICNQERKKVEETYHKTGDVQVIGMYRQIHEEGVDQLQQIIDALRDPQQRTSRRLILTAWNPQQLDQMALPPCHVLCQFHVRNGNQLSCALYQRSCDVALGVPFNIASYCFLTHLLAHHCGLVAHEFVHFMGDCHLYEQHVEPIQTQLQRVPFAFPKVSFGEKREKIEDYVVGDFCITNYQHHEPIKMDMVA